MHQKRDETKLRALPKGVDGFSALHPLYTDGITSVAELNRYAWILYDKSG